MRNRYPTVELTFVFVLANWICLRATADELSFRRDIVPVITKAGCNSGACHGSLQGRGGLALSLLGFDPAADYESLFLKGRGRRVSLAAAEQSLILRKASGRMPHGGGVRLNPTSEDYRLLRKFIEQGIPSIRKDDAKIVRLVTEPPTATLSPGQSREIQVTAEWDDGTVRDVTHWSLFDSRDSQIVEVTPLGKIKAMSSGKSPLTVRFLGLVASVDVTVPYQSDISITNFSPANYIDDLALAQWQRVGVQPAPLATDSEFVRRVYLDLIGTLPSSDEVRQFLDSTDVKKRAKLIDALLERPEYVDYWSLKWSDLLRAHRRYVGDKGLETFQGWIRRSVREDKPLDEMVRELITAQGDCFPAGQSDSISSIRNQKNSPRQQRKFFSVYVCNVPAVTTIRWKFGDRTTITVWLPSSHGCNSKTQEKSASGSVVRRVCGRR